MHAVSTGANHCDLIVLISTQNDERVKCALNKAREIVRGQILTLFADQLLPAMNGQTSEKGAQNA